MHISDFVPIKTQFASILVKSVYIIFLQLERDAGRLDDCRARLNYCPLGACALAGTGLPIDRFMTSDALGFTGPMRNRYAFLLEYISVLDVKHAFSLVSNWEISRTCMSCCNLCMNVFSTRSHLFLTCSV